MTTTEEQLQYDDETAVNKLKKQHHSGKDPLIAHHLNALAKSSVSCHDYADALKHHRDALSILDWNRCNALLFDDNRLSREYALDMALTLNNIGDVMRRKNDFVGSAKSYKECLDLFLESLIDSGIKLKMLLNELEQQQGYDGNNGAVLDDVDCVEVGNALYGHSEYVRCVAGIKKLLREIQFAKFVSHSASSRRRRRINNHRAVENNLKKAVESLSMSSGEDLSMLKEAKPSLQRLITPETEPNIPSLSHRAVTSVDDDQNRYDGISTLIAPVEKALVIALKRFPAPKTVAAEQSRVDDQDSVQGSAQQDETLSKLLLTNVSLLEKGTKSPRSVRGVNDSIGVHLS